MNEKLQYSLMLDIPENTASVVIKAPKKRKTKKKETPVEDVKEKVIEKVNENVESTSTNPPSSPIPEVKEVEDNQNPNQTGEVVSEDVTEVGGEVIPIENIEVAPTEETGEPIKTTDTVSLAERTAVVTRVATQTKKSRNKRTFKRPSLIKVQVALIGALIGVILLTSVINKNSGLNVFMRNVFAPSGLEEVDERLYTEFAPVFSSVSGEITLDENGIITTGAEGSVYSPLSGVVESVSTSEDGAFDVVVKHSENFSSKIGGLKFVYLEKGQKVTTTLPLGYALDGGATMCFMGKDGEIIKDYNVTDNSVIWAV